MELECRSLFLGVQLSSYADLGISRLILKTSRIILFLVRWNLRFLEILAYLFGWERVRRPRGAPPNFSESVLQLLKALGALIGCLGSLIKRRIGIGPTLDFVRQFFNKSENSLVGLGKSRLKFRLSSNLGARESAITWRTPVSVLFGQQLHQIHLQIWMGSFWIFGVVSDMFDLATLWILNSFGDLGRSRSRRIRNSPQVFGTLGAFSAVQPGMQFWRKDIDDISSSSQTNFYLLLWEAPKFWGSTMFEVTSPAPTAEGLILSKHTLPGY